MLIFPSQSHLNHVWWVYHQSSMHEHFNVFFIVPQIASQFLKVNKMTVDLVGVEAMKASENVRHIIMPCASLARSQLLPDIIRHHSRLISYFYSRLSLLRMFQVLPKKCKILLLCAPFLFSGGRTIIFTETKDYCSELAGVLPGARPLHGDIQQSQREVGCQKTYLPSFKLMLMK